MRNILKLLLICSLLLVAGTSNAETIPVIAPYSIDNVSISVTLRAWTGSCNGTQYGPTSASVTSGTSVNITGPPGPIGTTTYYINATGSGGTGNCASASYTWNGVVVTGPTSVPEGTTTIPYTATGCATPTWSITPLSSYANISSGGVLTALQVPSNQTITVRATCGADVGNLDVTITNVASTTPGAPAIGNIVR